jgi:hypothetical protein
VHSFCGKIALSFENQLSFDLPPANLPKIGDILLSLDSKNQNIICDEKKWPTNILCALVYDGGHYDAFFANLLNQGRDIIDLRNSFFDEYDFFDKFANAENKNKNLLIISNRHPKSLKIKLADLKSRLDNVFVIETIIPNRNNFTLAFEKWAKLYGIILSKRDQERLFLQLPSDFVIFSQLIDVILEKYQSGTRLIATDIDDILTIMDEKSKQIGLFDGDADTP